MEKYRDFLHEHKSEYEIGPNCILAWLDEEKKIQVEKLQTIKKIAVPLFHMADEEWELIKKELHAALPHASQEWIVDGNRRGIGLFLIKNV